MKDLMNFEHRWKLRDWIDESKLIWRFLSKNPNAMYLLEQNIDKMNWENLSSNPSEWAFRILQQNMDKLNWECLSLNPSEWAIDLLEKNVEKIVWYLLSKNPSAIRLLEQNMDKIDWMWLSENPSAIHLLEQNQCKIDWERLSSNPSAIHLLEQYIDRIDPYYLCKNPHPFAFQLFIGYPGYTEYMSLYYNTSIQAIDIFKKNKDKIFWPHLSSNPSIFELDYDFFYQRMNIIREELLEKAWHPSRFQNWCL